MTRKVLLTGATGFIGHHCLNRLLKTNLDVYALSRHPQKSISGVTWVECDLLKASPFENVMANLWPDYLIHAAWYLEHGKFWTSPLNVDYIFSTIALWKLFLKYQGIRAIFLGTGAEYTCVTNFNDATLYARSKFITAQLVSMIHTQNPISSFVWGRVGGIFGPGENLNRFVPYVINTFLQKKIPAIQNPDAVYAWVYVKDLADRLVAMLSEETPEMVDFGIDNRLSLKELSTLVNDLLEPESSVNQDLNASASSRAPGQTSIPFTRDVADYISYLKSFSQG